jgi:hypothetical protein
MADNLDELLADIPTGTEDACPAKLPDDADDKVELALYRRCTGGVTWVESLDRNGLPVRLARELPGDPKAARDWLAVRRPDRWPAVADDSARQAVGISVRVTVMGRPLMTIGHVVDGEVTPATGLIGGAGPGDP